MNRIQKVSTSIVAFFLLIPGLAKFTDPFKTMFTVQIEKSELPFASLSFIVGQGAEILIGALLFALLFWGTKFSSAITNTLFTIGNLFVYPIMAVAIYVHLHPAVPASVLPMESKPPVLAIILLIGATVNLIIQNKKRKA